MAVILPHKFIPRPYQMDTFKAFFKDGYKRFIDIEHRRAGKDKKWINIILAASQQRVGTYLHAFPKLNQARKAIWKGRDKEGLPFLAHFPQSLIKRVDNTEMSIEFTNGSTYRLAGADNYDRWMGTNPIGIVFSEYSLQHPSAASYFNPILLENEGWSAYIYTPRGKNHGYELYEQNRDNPDWFVQFLPITKTMKNDGCAVMTEEDIERLRRDGESEEMIQQEYYCSFTSAILGAYFSNEMKWLYENDRIFDFHPDPRLPIHTAWDIGRADSTAIWFFQVVNSEFRFVHYYENNNQGLPHYINYLHQYRERNSYVYGEHYGPHDIDVIEFSTNKSRRQMARELGVDFRVVPRVQQKQNAIEASRMMLRRCFISKSGCKIGLRCLTEYSREYNEAKHCFEDRPKHDWTSHGADAFMTFAMGWKDQQKRPSDRMGKFNSGKI